MTSGSPIFTRPAGGLNGSRGKVFVVRGANGPAADPLVAVGLNVISDTQVELDVDATATVASSVGAFGTDNIAAILEAYEDCVFRGVGSLLVPNGGWLFRGNIIGQSNVHLYGRGMSSVLYSASFDESCLDADGLTGIGFSRLSFASDAVVRKTNPESVRLLIRNCSDVQFDQIHINGGSSAGVFIVNSTIVRGGTVFVRNTLADGVHVTDGSSNVRIETVNGFNTGDDTFAVVSYAEDPHGQVEDVTCGFVKSVGSGGRGFGIVGPRHVQVMGYQIEDPFAHGFVVAYEPAFNTFVPSDVTIGPGSIKGVNSSPSYSGFFVGGFEANIPSDIKITEPTLTDSNQVLVTSAKDVRIKGMDKSGGNYRGILVQNCENVKLTDSAFSDLTDEAVTFDNVIGGRVENCTANECQSVGNASRGRFSFLDCKRIIGKGNYDFRDTASSGDSIGALLVSNSTTPADALTNLIEVNGHNPNAAVGSRVFGMLYDGMRKLLRLDNDFEPVNEALYSAVLKKGMYLLGGPVQIDSNDSFRGSGAAASLNLFSGQADLAAEAAVGLWANRSGAVPGASIDFRHGAINAVRIVNGGQMFTYAGVSPSNTASGHGYYAITGGSPEGVITAPAGSLCLRDLGALGVVGIDGPAYYKQSGSGAFGWVPVNLGTELPPIGGNARKQLRVNNGATAINWGKVPLDDPGAVELPSISDQRYIYHTSGGQLVGRGPADIWDAIEAIAKAALNHTHDYSDDNGGSSSTKTTSGPSW